MRPTRSMTPQELAELRELAGLNEPKTQAEINKEWADAQMTNVPNVENPQTPQTPQVLVGFEEFGKANNINIQADREIEGLAARLNRLLGSDFASTVKIERL